MAHWTTGELRTLKAAHAAGHISHDRLAAMFPRHSVASTLRTAYALGINRDISRLDLCLRWLRIAHEHFARREAGLLA